MTKQFLRSRIRNKSIALGDAIWEHQNKISCVVGFAAGVAIMKYTRVNARP